MWSRNELSSLAEVSLYSPCYMQLLFAWERAMGFRNCGTTKCLWCVQGTPVWFIEEKRSCGVVRTSGRISNPWPPDYEAAVMFHTMSLVYKVSVLLWITVQDIRPLHWSYSKYGMWPSLAAGIFCFEFNQLKMFVTGHKGSGALSVHALVQHTSAYTQYGNAVRYILKFHDCIVVLLLTSVCLVSDKTCLLFKWHSNRFYF